MAEGGERTRNDSGVETDSDGSTTMSVGSPPHRNNYPLGNQLDEGIIDAPSVPDLPPQEVRVLEIPRPQQMDMCPLSTEDSRPSLAAAEEKLDVALKNVDAEAENNAKQFDIDTGALKKNVVPFSYLQGSSGATGSSRPHAISRFSLKRISKNYAESFGDGEAHPQLVLNGSELVEMATCGGGKLSKSTTRRGRVTRMRSSCMYPKKPPRKSDDNALREAAAVNDLTRCEELLKNGACAEACDGRRRTALHFAATIRGGAPLVNLLLRNGADPNAQDIAGNTPMHLAICINNGPVIQELLQHGGDLAAVDRFGRNPLQLATGRLRLILVEASAGARHEVSERARQETLRMISSLQEYAQQRKDDAALGASASIFSSFQARFFASESPAQFSADVSDLLSSLENLQLL